MNLKYIQTKHYQWLESVGWAHASTPLEQVALIASEIGEAANELRGPEPTARLGSELADIILRTLGLAERLGIDMETEIKAKMDANAKRGTKGRLK
ncbi:putative pyrophosphatase [Opitutaceae bacterium TAV1]|nr:putative pyrophosphatase [Opitutaceae bacterium TAV1]